MPTLLITASSPTPKANENITVVVRLEEQLPALPQQAETVEPAKQLPASFEEAPPAPAVEIKNGSKEQVASAKSESHQESPSTAPLEEEQIVFTEPEPSSEPSNEGLPKHLNQQIAEDLGVNYKCLEAVIADAKRKGMLGLEKRQPMTVASLEQAAAVVREITELELLKPKDFCRGEGLEISLREFGVRLHHAKLKRWVGGYYRREDLMAVWQKWQGRSSEAPAAPPAELPGSVKGEEITVVPLEEKQIASAERQGAKAIRGDSLPENVKGVEEGLEWEEVWRVAVDFDISCEDLTAALGRSVADQNLASVKMEGTRTRAPLRLLEQLARALAQATNPLKAA